MAGSSDAQQADREKMAVAWQDPVLHSMVKIVFFGKFGKMAENWCELVVKVRCLMGVCGAHSSTKWGIKSVFLHVLQIVCVRVLQTVCFGGVPWGGR